MWVNTEEANAIAVIDTRAAKVLGTIPLPGCHGPGPLAFDATNRVLFSACGDKVMTAVNADTGATLATVPVGEDPDGIAYDPDRRRVVVGNRDGTWTVIAQRGKRDYVVERTLPIDRYAKTLAVDPATHRLFPSTSDLIWGPVVPGKKHLPSASPGSFRLMAVSEK